jgi:plastocyanin
MEARTVCARSRLPRCFPARGVPFLLAVSVLASVGLLPSSAAQLPATGAIEGEVALSNEAPALSAERYVGANGEARDVARIPVIVFVEGSVPAAATARSSGPLQVAQRNQMFEPHLLVVPVGASVAFPNRDPEFHNVFSYSRAKRFDLGRYRQGEEKRVVFDRPGYIKVLCEVHKWMRAAIVVVENPYYALVSDTGKFRIDGVAPGRYRLIVERFDQRSQVAEVDVREGATTRLNVQR